MRSKAQRVTIIDMLCHLLSGAGLGAVLALALMRGNGIIADMIDESAAPKFLMLVSIAIFIFDYRGRIKHHRVHVDRHGEGLSPRSRHESRGRLLQALLCLLFGAPNAGR